jgi:hypothetical protein
VHVTDRPGDEDHPPEETPGPFPGTRRSSAFIALGIAFFVMGLALDDMRAFIGVGIAFLAVGASQRGTAAAPEVSDSSEAVDGD